LVEEINTRIKSPLDGFDGQQGWRRAAPGSKPRPRIDAVQRCKVPSRRSDKVAEICADAIAAVGPVELGEVRAVRFDEGNRT
jgi:hypothetical protein